MRINHASYLTREQFYSLVQTFRAREGEAVRYVEETDTLEIQKIILV